MAKKKRASSGGKKALPDLTQSGAAFFQKALRYQEEGRLEEAEQCYLAILARQPENPIVYYNLAGVQLEANRLADAEQSYLRAIALRPEMANAHFNRGGILLRQQRQEEAYASFQRTLALCPEQADLLVQLGNAFRSLGYAKEAEQSYRQAISLQPGSAEAYDGLAVTLLAQGRRQEGEQACLSAIDCDPGHAPSYHNLAAIRSFTAEDPLVAKMEQLLSQKGGSLSANDFMLLHYSLGKAYGDLGQFAKSIEHFNAGSRLKRQSINYSGFDSERKFRLMANTFNAEKFSQENQAFPESKMAIFIVGMPRSGTTLVEQILSSHSMIKGAGEIEDFETAIREVATKRVAAGNASGSVADFSQADYRAIGERYLALLKGHARGEDNNALKITNKLPSNFFFTGLIHLALPEARIIHCRRNPLDTCLSCYTLLFARGQEFSYSMEELGIYYRLYEELMAHWRRVLPPERILEVTYEDLVTDTERNARRMIEYCGLEWEPGCLRFFENRRPVFTASHGQVRKPIYRDSIERWRRYGEALRPLFNALAP